MNIKNSRRLDSDLFKKEFNYWCDRIGEKVEVAEKIFVKELEKHGGSIIQPGTIHRSWKYRSPVLKDRDYAAIEAIFGVDCTKECKSKEEENMATALKPLTLQSELAYSLYQKIFMLIHSEITFDSTIEEIEMALDTLNLEYQSKSVFLMPSLAKCFEAELESLAALVEEDTYSEEYDPAIGYFDETGAFVVQNIPMLIKVRNKILAPHKAELEHLAERILANL